MPNLKLGVRLGVADGALVYMYEHRIPKVASRIYPYDAIARHRLMIQLRSNEYHNVSYTVRTRMLSRIDGMINAVSPGGVRYKVHHTDVMRA